MFACRMQHLSTQAAPNRPALRLPVRHRAAVVVRAAGDELEAWQVTKLQQALTAGRRQVKVSAVLLGASPPAVAPH